MLSPRFKRVLTKVKLRASRVSSSVAHRASRAYEKTPWVQARKRVEKARDRASQVEFGGRGERIHASLVRAGRARNRVSPEELARLEKEYASIRAMYFKALDVDPEMILPLTQKLDARFTAMNRTLEMIQSGRNAFDKRYRRSVAALAARYALYRLGIPQSKRNARVHRAIRELVSLHPTLAHMGDIDAGVKRLLKNRAFDFFMHYQTFYHKFDPLSFQGKGSHE